MAGSALAVGTAAAAAALTVALAVAAAAAVESQRVAGIADAAALAAADAASGAATGEPCARAAEVAAAQRATVATCAVDGLIATVTVRAAFAGLPVEVAARAGPPPAARTMSGRRPVRGVYGVHRRKDTRCHQARSSSSSSPRRR